MCVHTRTNGHACTHLHVSHTCPCKNPCSYLPSCTHSGACTHGTLSVELADTHTQTDKKKKNSVWVWEREGEKKWARGVQVTDLGCAPITLNLINSSAALFKPQWHFIFPLTPSTQPLPSLLRSPSYIVSWGPCHGSLPPYLVVTWCKLYQ